VAGISCLAFHTVVHPKLLELIRCPVDRQPLMQASESVVSAINQCIQRRELRDASDAAVEEPMEEALVTIDGTRAHAVRGGIPTLIPAESIELPDAIRTLVELPVTAN
jgi:uncharacterized protein YbaR (Trm112 family)